MSEPKEKTAEGIQLAEIAAARGRLVGDWMKESERGDRLNDFFKGGHYDILNREVLEPLEREAFNTIKAPEFDPENKSMVYQLRALCQTVDLIRGRIQQIIGDGISAKVRISEYNSTPKEGE